MYSTFQLAKKYLDYYFTASSRKGHGIHSPFVFDFIEKVLNNKSQYPEWEAIEVLRERLLKDNRVIEVEDFGAGSSLLKTKHRVVKSIAASSLKSKKFSRLLFRIIQYYKPSTIVELGTSFGITTSYVAKANVSAGVYTLEGSPAIADIADENFKSLSLENINLVRGDFEQVLPGILTALSKIDLVFIDGNHRLRPTLKYFQQLLPHLTASSIVIFDDIHWSAEMEEAWTQIKQNSSVKLTLDLFFMGIVFINPDFKVKQHFKIRF